MPQLILERESANWSSGNLQIDEFIRKAQQSLYYTRYHERIPYNFYIRYPEWISYNCLTKIKHIGRSEFEAKLEYESTFNYRSALPRFVLLLCLIWNSSTSEYMLVEPSSLCSNCQRKVLIGKCSNWSSGCLFIDEFIRKAQLTIPYNRYPEWIPYDSFTEIKHIRGKFCALISAEWSKEPKNI
ncbi:354_t:CDS:2 [Racocetra persica]|uniref:354_t:CDS:1 n=1 Tax=Racocetra persica TaxID=160502 RepID=A0ACA9MS32_9GLOM|nr:354_t:CDS:2 [Racocetra persica]